MYLVLFWIFAKIGTFTLGGGYAMLPLIQRELVDNKKYLWAKNIKLVDNKKYSVEILFFLPKTICWH